jgi:1,4-dihydroxy-2-naphthoyl-CoA hydrolase
LHGGALVAFAETLCSVAAYVHVNGEVNHCVGQEINANHIRTSVTGTAFGEAKPIHIGRSSQVWGIEIKNEEGKLLSVSRCTVAVVPHKKR